MRWDDLADQPCSISRALAVIGDRWTLLVPRDCFAGVSKFEQFGRNLGIARNLLSARLRLLVEEGVLERRAYQDNPVRYDYYLTSKGEALHPVLLAVSHFGDVYYAGEAGPPELRRHTRCGCDFQPVQVCSECLAPLKARDVATRPAPKSKEQRRAARNLGAHRQPSGA